MLTVELKRLKAKDYHENTKARKHEKQCRIEKIKGKLSETPSNRVMSPGAVYGSLLTVVVPIPDYIEVFDKGRGGNL